MSFFLPVLVVCGAAMLSVWFRRRQTRGAAAKAPSPYVDPKDWLDPAKLGIRTASEANERAARLLPMKGSEDVSGRLVRPKSLPAPTPNHGPREAVEWVIDVAAAHGRVFKRSEVLEVFNPGWCKENGGPTVYGRGALDKEWTYAYAAGPPDDYDQLALGIDFTSLAGESLTESRLNEIVDAIGRAAARLDADVPSARLPVKAAVGRARELDALHEEFEDARAVVLLAAPEGETFDGKAIWDVMMCLGLRWGDMDEFHWENEDRARGDDHLFSVSSAMAPGYFLPEEIAAGRLHVGNLVFDFSVPRSIDPKGVLDGMLAAATYAQERLGGELVDEEGEDLDAALLREQVEEIVARLGKAGFSPGEDATLRLF